MPRTSNIEALRYPIGQASIPQQIHRDDIDRWIQILETFPKELRTLVEDLNDEQLATPYREGGWTIRQVIHHVADSHHHSYIRFKWALTEATPVIRAYDEARWAELHDTRHAPIELSLNALTTTHAKLVYFLNGLQPADFEKSFIHPETNKEVKLAENVGIYAWHSRHHYAHIENLLIRQGWQ